MSDGAGKVIEQLGAVASVLTLGVTVYLAIREGLTRRAREKRETVAALDMLERELLLLDGDAQRALQSVRTTVPGIPGFRLRADPIGESFGTARPIFSGDQRDTIEDVLRNATDANRAMDAGLAVPNGTGERVRQYRLIELKASHLFDTNEHGITRLQVAQKSVASARRRYLRGETA